MSGKRPSSARSRSRSVESTEPDIWCISRERRGPGYYSDVDYFASIPSQNQRDDSAYMLRVLKQVLQDRFPNTFIHIDTPAVVCEFGTDGSEKMEVIPAYYVGRDDTDT